jgi:hypothetical protein
MFFGKGRPPTPVFNYRETKFSLKVGLGQEELHGIRNDLRKIHVSWYKRLKR